MNEHTPDALTPNSDTVLAPAAATAPTSDTVTSAAPPASEPEATVPEANLHVTMTDSPISAAKRKDEYPLYVYRMSTPQITQVAQRHPYNSINEGTLQGEWGHAFIQAANVAIQDGAFTASFERPGSKWQQNIEYEGRKLGMRRPRVVQNPGLLMTGEAAVAKFQSTVKMGGLLTFPLWGSGIWVTVRTPADSSLNILDQYISSQKIKLGRESNGLVFSNHNVYMNSSLMDFLVEHTVSANIKDFEPNMLRHVMRSYDFPVTMHGLACAIYTNGYTISQPCFVDPTACTHLTKEHVNLTKLAWVDSSQLTPTQIRHMANPDKLYSIEEIMAYQQEGIIADGRTFDIRMDEYDDTIVTKVVLKVPTVGEHINAGIEWISSIVNTTERALGDKFLNAKKKEEFLKSQALLTTLRQYSPFVKRIVNDDESYMEERADVEKALDILSANMYAVGQLLDAVAKYIDDTVISLIALPAFACPNCKKPLVNPDSTHPHLIPLEVNQLFFTLVARKLWLLKSE